MSVLTFVHPPLATVASSTSPWHWDISFLAKLSRDLFRELRSSYRPELHYMRGPGPRWREKHGAVSRDGGIHSLTRPEGKNTLPEIQQHKDTVQGARTHGPERPAMSKRMPRETATVTAINFNRGHTQAREIVEARRGLIAELEQRRRIPWNWDHELSQAA
jgi:hypothetical protein